MISLGCQSVCVCVFVAIHTHLTRCLRSSTGSQIWNVYFRLFAFGGCIGSSGMYALLRIDLIQWYLPISLRTDRHHVEWDFLRWIRCSVLVRNNNNKKSDKLTGSLKRKMILKRSNCVHYAQRARWLAILAAILTTTIDRQFTLRHFSYSNRNPQFTLRYLLLLLLNCHLCFDTADHSLHQRRHAYNVEVKSQPLHYIISHARDAEEKWKCCSTIKRYFIVAVFHIFDEDKCSVNFWIKLERLKGLNQQILGRNGFI